jgi:dihydropteroate synthase
MADMTRTLIMGVINATPDSFYDGGRNLLARDARRHALAMARDGADWLDIGGESSRPGADPVGVEEELSRVMPVIEAVRGAGLPLSIDTYHAETARNALDMGVQMVNDISALRMDPGMAEVIAEKDCRCVLMHMQGTPRTMQRNPVYGDVVSDIRAFFEERMTAAVSAGIREDRIWLDPGFGFGKTPAHNLTLLRRLDEFRDLGRPILIGTSNKATIGKVLDLPAEERTEGTAATVAVAITRGVHCVRVHDVKTMARVARMCGAILDEGWNDNG